MAAAGKVTSSFASTVMAACLAWTFCVWATPSSSQQASARAPATKPQSSKPKAQKPEAAKQGAATRPVQSAAKPKQAAPPKSPAPQAAPQPAPAPAAPQRKLTPLPPVDTSVPPPMLPRASRERMRACAEEWEKKKRSATAGLPMWRDFATGCLTR